MLRFSFRREKDKEFVSFHSFMIDINLLQFVLLFLCFLRLYLWLINNSRSSLFSKILPLTLGNEYLIGGIAYFLS